MATLVENNVDYRLLNNMSNLVICSQCLRAGRITPVPQIISKHRRLSNVCSSCRERDQPNKPKRRLGKLLKFPGI